MVSMVSSPPAKERCVEIGLPNGLPLGDISTPLIDADLLVGGDVPNPCDETGDRTGDGDLLWPEDKELRPAT